MEYVFGFLVGNSSLIAVAIIVWAAYRIIKWARETE